VVKLGEIFVTKRQFAKPRLKASKLQWISDSDVQRHPIASNREEEDILNDLRVLCSSPGFIHAISFFCWRDNLILFEGDTLVRSDLEHQQSGDRLLTTEILTLVGMMLQAPIEYSQSNPVVWMAYVSKAEQHLKELHDCLSSTVLNRVRLSKGEIEGSEHRFSGDALREPIFYASESGYPFQFRDLAPKKYENDSEWLDGNRGFTVAQAIDFANRIAKFQLDRALQFANDFGEVCAERSYLPAFLFSFDEALAVGNLSHTVTSAILDSFSCDETERNPMFQALGDFNIVQSKPILRLSSGHYFLSTPRVLFESIYETPFYWMTKDPLYRPQAAKSRGSFTEDVAYDYLVRVFGKDCCYKNVTLFRGKNRVGEIDILVVFGDRILTIQAKSKRLTIASRKGNDLALSNDFKLAVGAAYAQSVSCIDALIDGGHIARTADGLTIKLPKSISAAYPLCVICDSYPALASQVRDGLQPNTERGKRAPFVSDVFVLDTLTELLATPIHFLNYLELRARCYNKVIVTYELAALGYHLSKNLWFGDETSAALLDDSLAVQVDIAMMARRDGVPGETTPPGLLTRYYNTPLGIILSELEQGGWPEMVGLGMQLNQLGSETGIALNSRMMSMQLKVQGEQESSDISLPHDQAGFTFHYNLDPVLSARLKLEAHCSLRKYIARSDCWFGLVVDPRTGRIRGAMRLQYPWHYDPVMEAHAIQLPKSKPVSINPNGPPLRIGRNDLCYCGSGKKYKKCCIA